MSTKDRQDSPTEPVVTTLDAALTLARTSGNINDADGRPLALIEDLDGYVLCDCLIPEERLADMSMRCEVAIPDSDGFICRGYMAQRDLLYRVKIAVRQSGAYELLDVDLIAQILKPEKIEDVLARLSRS